MVDERGVLFGDNYPVRVGDNYLDWLARRWVIEVCHSRFNRLRKLLVRYEKMDRSYLGLLMLVASVIVLRKISRKDQGNIIYG